MVHTVLTCVKTGLCACRSPWASLQVVAYTPEEPTPTHVRPQLSEIVPAFLVNILVVMGIPAPRADHR
jgi:hypothetical protein